MDPSEIIVSSTLAADEARRQAATELHEKTGVTKATNIGDLRACSASLERARVPQAPQAPRPIEQNGAEG